MRGVVWLAVFGAALLGSVDVYATKREPLWTGFLTAIASTVAGFGAMNVETVVATGDAVETVGATEFSVTILCVANALLALVVAAKAATGAYDRAGDDRSLSDPTAGALDTDDRYP